MASEVDSLSVGKGLLMAGQIETPLGLMIAISDQDALYLLEFLNDSPWEQEIERLQYILKDSIIPGNTKIFDMIKQELGAYFEGKLREFTTKVKTLGTPFQKQVLSELRKIPFGKTCCYGDIASKLENKGVVRAIGTANGANRLPIIIPCHRVINADGKLGGYAGGIDRKRWLLAHEASLV